MKDKDSKRLQFRIYKDRDPAVYEFLKGMSSTSANRLVAVLLETHVLQIAKGQTLDVSSKALTKTIQNPKMIGLEKSSPIVEGRATSQFERWSRGVYLVFPENQLNHPDPLVMDRI